MWVRDASWVLQAPPESRRRDVIGPQPAESRRPLEEFTQRPPRVAGADPMWRSLCMRRGWRGENDHRLGPAKGRKGKGKSKRKGKGNPHQLSEHLVQMPSTAATDSPISRLAEQLARDSLEFDGNTRHTGRVWKARQGRCGGASIAPDDGRGDGFPAAITYV